MLIVCLCIEWKQIIPAVDLPQRGYMFCVKLLFLT